MPKTICNQFTYSPCLQLWFFTKCRKLPSRVENPQWRSRFPIFCHYLSFVFFALITLFKPFSENPKVASPIKGRTHRLSLPSHKAPFRKHRSSFAGEKVGPTMSFYPFIKAFVENWLLTSKPTMEKLFLDFLPINIPIISLSSN